MKKKLMTILMAVSILVTPSSSLGHGGRTDSSGGHKDNKNKSGLGYYHYHCGGNGPHLHNDGKCPYNSKTSTKSKSSKTSNAKVSSSNIEGNKKVQKKLNELGYKCGKVDGIFGTNTKQSIKSFQRSKGLQVDGLAGPKTRLALGI